MIAALRQEAGQSMVEFALLLPLLVFGLMGGADLARAFAIQLAVQNAARAGAEAYAITSARTPSLAQQAAVEEMNRTPTVNALPSNVAVTEGQSDGSACIHPPPPANPCFVTVTVIYSFQTITAWPFVPNTAIFNRTTTFRMFY